MNINAGTISDKDLLLDYMRRQKIVLIETYDA